MLTEKTQKLQDIKGELEVKKLEAEINTLKRSFLTQPSFWISIVALIVSFSTNIAQYSAAEYNRQLAEIKYEKLSHKSTLLEEELEKKTNDLSIAINKLNEINNQIVFGEQKIKQLDISIKSGELVSLGIINGISELVRAANSDSDILLAVLFGAGLKYIIKNPSIVEVIDNTSKGNDKNKVKEVEENSNQEREPRDTKQYKEGRSTYPFLAIYFDYQSSTLRPDQISRLDINAKYLLSKPNLRIQIEANTEDRGSEESNFALAENMVSSVKNHLLGLGVKETQLLTLSYGETKPLLHGHDELSRAQNRRVDFVTLSK